MKTNGFMFVINDVAYYQNGCVVDLRAGNEGRLPSRDRIPTLKYVKDDVCVFENGAMLGVCAWSFLYQDNPASWSFYQSGDNNPCMVASYGMAMNHFLTRCAENGVKVRLRDPGECPKEEPTRMEIETTQGTKPFPETVTVDLSLISKEIAQNSAVFDELCTDIRRNLDKGSVRLDPTPAPRCECGSAKLGFPGHSDWCPMASGM
jgi:hypothetical protein